MLLPRDAFGESVGGAFCERAEGLPLAEKSFALSGNRCFPALLSDFNGCNSPFCGCYHIFALPNLPWIVSVAASFVVGD